MSARALLPGRGKNRLRKSLSTALPGVAAWFVRTLCATLRVRGEDEARFFGTEGGKILLLWHGRPFPLIARMRGMSITILISLSRDGELINRVLQSLGYDAARGSTGPSGARALASLIKTLRAGGVVAVTPDGPRGPSGVLQPGVLAMARKSGRPLIPTGSSSRPRLTMRSWDRFTLPLPFSRSLILFGEPVWVPEDADDAVLESLRQRVEGEMRRLQDEADRRLGVPTFAEIMAKKPLASSGE